MPNSQTVPVLDPVFRALAHPTRRAVVDRLSRGPAAVSELAEPFGVSLPTFLQHLEVLEESGLVRSAKVGRLRVCRLVPRPLDEAERWMRERRRDWEARLDQLDDYLLRLRDEEDHP